MNNTTKACLLDGCSSTSSCKGYCRRHYRSFHRYGDPLVKGRATHGMGYSSENRIWASMKYRCHNNNSSSYGSYGGRGIIVCDRWRYSFENFYADMGPRPTMQHSIDRIDNDGNYEPSNCRWATKKEQIHNRRPFNLSKANKSGHTGIFYDRVRTKWTAYINKDGIRIQLGRFVSIEEAIKAREEALAS